MAVTGNGEGGEVSSIDWGPVCVLLITGTAPVQGFRRTLRKTPNLIRDRFDSPAGGFRVSVTQLATRERGDAKTR